MREAVTSFRIGKHIAVPGAHIAVTGGCIAVLGDCSAVPGAHIGVLFEENAHFSPEMPVFPARHDLLTRIQLLVPVLAKEISTGGHQICALDAKFHSSPITDRRFW